MATSSMTTQIKIENKQTASEFIKAMEQAELWAKPYVIGVDLASSKLTNNLKGEKIMVKTQINIDTMSKVRDFVNIATDMKGAVKLIGKDAEGAEVIVNARSLMGAIYSMEWNEVWCEHESDEYSKIRKFAI